MPEFDVGTRTVGDGHRPLVVAELGINHEGVLEVALEMAHAAIKAGAEVIKHQTHIPDEEMSQEASSIVPGNADTSIYEIISRCALSELEEQVLCNFITDQGSIFISTPFSLAAVDRLERLQVPALKIGSGECTHLPLIDRACDLNVPLIISTGMHHASDLDRTVQLVRTRGVPFALLHCTNLYPTPPQLVRLGGIADLQQRFPDAVVGLSDHSETIYPALASVALGARILERHFTDNRERPGPDIVCSMTPDELRELITAAETVALASGGTKSALSEEKVTAAFAIGSVVARVPLIPGNRIGPSDLTIKRPSGGGFAASELPDLEGMYVVRFVDANTQVPRDALARS